MHLHAYLYLVEQAAELEAAIKELRATGADLPEVQRQNAWIAGDLRWKLQAHQQDVYDRFQEWNLRRLTPEYRERARASLKAPMFSVWVEEIARRFGKTWKWLVILCEIAIKRPGAFLTYATAAQKDIGGIIVPLAEAIAEDAPDEVRPEYHPSKGEVHEGLFFPNGSVIKLVGIDAKPKALRGKFSDGFVISEAGHVEGREKHARGLEATVRGKILPQFQRRPHAFLALETSSPEDPDHDFLRVFRPDAEARGAYVARTIDDNTAITDEERQQFIDESGGRGHHIAEREYYNVVERDPARYVVPEFKPELHVRAHERPPYALCCTAADPGAADLFGLVFGYYDFLAARGVIEWSWAKGNPSYREVACVIAWAEWKLWGRWPEHRLASVPVDDETDRQGWVQLLASTPATRDECAALAAMASAAGDDRPVSVWRKYVPPEHFGYWDGKQFAQNPRLRVTDVDKLFMRSLQAEYGVLFSQSDKDDARAQVNRLRDAFGGNQITMLPTAGPVIAHTKEARKKEGSDDWERHPVHGHFDALAALVYWWRNLDRARNPNPPAAALATAQHFVPDVPRERTAAERIMFGDGKGGVGVPRLRGRPLAGIRRRR